MSKTKRLSQSPHKRFLLPICAPAGAPPHHSLPCHSTLECCSARNSFTIVNESREGALLCFAIFFLQATTLPHECTLLCDSLQSQEPLLRRKEWWQTKKYFYDNYFEHVHVSAGILLSWFPLFLALLHSPKIMFLLEQGLSDSDCGVVWRTPLLFAGNRFVGAKVAWKWNPNKGRAVSTLRVTLAWMERSISLHWASKYHQGDWSTSDLLY